MAHQGALSMGFTRQEYWSGLPFPAPGDLSIPGIKPQPSAVQVDSSLTESPRKTLDILGGGLIFIIFNSTEYSDQILIQYSSVGIAGVNCVCLSVSWGGRIVLDIDQDR